MPNLDLLIYRDFDSVDVDLEVGDDAQQKLGSGFNGLHIAAVGPPIHDGKDYAVVLAAETRPTMMQRLKGFFGPRQDQVVGGTVEVVPMFREVDAPDAVGLVATGNGVSEQIERKRTYVINPDEADELARKLGAVAQHVRNTPGRRERTADRDASQGPAPRSLRSPTAADGGMQSAALPQPRRGCHDRPMTDDDCIALSDDELVHAAYEAAVDVLERRRRARRDDARFGRRARGALRARSHPLLARAALRRGPARRAA